MSGLGLSKSSERERERERERKIQSLSPLESICVIVMETMPYNSTTTESVNGVLIFAGDSDH